MPDAAAAAPKPRLGWIDTARGMTMLMVVLLHADVVAQAMQRPVLAVTLLDHAFFPLRMPMFFLVSGLLAAGLLRRAPAGEVLRRRVLHYAWLYLAWSLIYAAVHAWALAHLGPPGMQAYYNTVEGPAAALLVTWNNTWFLYVLMLFFATALLLRRLPPAAQMAIALLLALPGILDWGERLLGLPVVDRFYHFPYFLAGILASAWLREAVPRRLARPGVALGFAAAWLALAAAAHVARILRDPAGGGGDHVAIPALVVAGLSLLAVPAGLGAACLLAEQLPRLAAPLQYVGRNTLVVYVLHTMTLRVVMALVPDGVLPGILLLPLLSLAAIALALAIGVPLQRLVPPLFNLPGVSRLASRPGAEAARAA